MKRVGALTVAALLTITLACGGTNEGSKREILVFAAASLTETFTTIGADFQRHHPDTIVRFNFGPSDGLATGIAEGARADVFASASDATMDVVARSPGVSVRGIFARNKLVVITPKNDVRVSVFGDLAAPGVKLVVAGPGVPAGRYARQALVRAGLEVAERNIVSNEVDVKSVVQKVALGEADAGIVYVTDVTAATRKNVRSVVIPDDDNVIASYPIAVVKSDRSSVLARAFLSYILDAGQDVLREAGFLPPSS